MEFKVRNLRLIQQAEGEDFNDIFTKQGNKISFFQDNLGQSLISSDKETRETLFTSSSETLITCQVLQELSS